jgi:hypothetical protein
LDEFISRSNLHMVWGSCDCHVIATYRLPNLMNRKFVDEFAVEFCMSMNFKGNRARLARALFNVDKNRCTHTHIASSCSFWPIVVWALVCVERGLGKKFLGYIIKILGI